MLNNYLKLMFNWTEKSFKNNYKQQYFNQKNFNSNWAQEVSSVQRFLKNPNIKHLTKSFTKMSHLYKFLQPIHYF